MRLVNLVPEHLKSLYSAKRNAGISKRTVQHIHSVPRRSLNQVVKKGLIVRNPTDAVTPPRPAKKSPQTFSAVEVIQVLFAVSDHQWYPIYALTIYTGMRQGEIHGWHWEKIN